MKTSLFDYELPEAAIAQHPLADRDAARMLVLARDGVRHARFRDWAELVPEGALVVLNDTRVIKARILGARTGTHGKVEILLTRRLEAKAETEEIWLALGRSNRPLRDGTLVESGSLRIEVLGRGPGDAPRDGRFEDRREDSDLLRVRVRADRAIADALVADGHVPLPPYVRRADAPEDAERYQTVFARHEGSIAAPTAGLHVTPATLARLAERGVSVCYATLHVGIGTFRPVSADDLDDHPMHSEELSVSAELADAVSSTRARGRPVVAVGTTVVRALESARDPADVSRVLPVTAPTRLLIQPGYTFGPVDALLTNFHMPKSTLVALVAAFAGRERVLDAYRAALAEGYRFLSYGDAMWIPERLS